MGGSVTIRRIGGARSHTIDLAQNGRLRFVFSDDGVTPFSRSHIVGWDGRSSAISINGGAIGSLE
jgi:hypothetical protein